MEELPELVAQEIEILRDSRFAELPGGEFVCCRASKCCLQEGVWDVWKLRRELQHNTIDAVRSKPTDDGVMSPEAIYGEEPVRPGGHARPEIAGIWSWERLIFWFWHMRMMKRKVTRKVMSFPGFAAANSSLPFCFNFVWRQQETLSTGHFKSSSPLDSRCFPPATGFSSKRKLEMTRSNIWWCHLQVTIWKENSHESN